MKISVLRLFLLVLLFLINCDDILSQSTFMTGNNIDIEKVSKTFDIDKLNMPNYTYIIHDEIDLANREWKVPENSTLFFIGGKIKNGQLKLDNTLMQGNVMFSNIKMTGSCSNEELHMSWFCDDATLDYSNNLQILHDIAKKQSVIRIGSSKYLINNPVIITKALTLKGNSTRSYKDLGKEMYGSTLLTTKDINILVIKSRMVIIDGINFVGCSSYFTNKNVRGGSSSLIKYSWTSSGKVSDCNFLNSHIGLELFHSGIATVENNNFTLCNVGILADHSGDCNYINNYINCCDTNGKVFLNDNNVTEPNGIGIIFTPGSGNSNIIGGKIEGNNKGVVNAGSSGITILGVQFDYNKSGHIFYYQNQMQYDAGFNANSIVGCRFLGTPGSQHIYIRYMTATKINVTGNFFTCSGKGAFDHDKSGKIGPPRIFSVYERHLDDKYKNTCTISFGSNSTLNINKLCYAEPQIHNKDNECLIKFITPDNKLSSDGYMIIANSGTTN